MINPQPRHLALTGEQLVGVHAPSGEARFPIGIEPIFPDSRAAGVGHDAGGAEMVFEEVIKCTIDPHRPGHGIIGHRSRDRATRGLIHFVNASNVQGLAAIRFDLLHQIAVAIVDNVRRRSGNDRQDDTKEHLGANGLENHHFLFSLRRAYPRPVK